MVIVLTEDVLCDILRCLTPIALACHCWRRPLPPSRPSPPRLLLPPSPTPDPKLVSTPAFQPLDTSSPCLSLDFASDASHLNLYNCHLGLVLLLPFALSFPKGMLSRLLVLASRCGALLPQPSRDTLLDDRWCHDRYFVGATLLSRVHPSKLCFKVVCLTIDDTNSNLMSFGDGDGCFGWAVGGGNAHGHRPWRRR